MKRTTLTLGLTLATGIAIGALGTTALHAQGDGIKRTMLQRKDLTGVDGREVFMGTAEIAPGAAAGKHIHHGTEVGYVLEGSGVLEVEGEAPRTITAGDSYHIDPMKPHDAKNTGSAPVKVLAIYIVEKGKPLAEPVK
jgi:quercetin dioxygenase-like cupin family protein